MLRQIFCQRFHEIAAAAGHRQRQGQLQRRAWIWGDAQTVAAFHTGQIQQDFSVGRYHAVIILHLKGNNQLALGCAGVKGRDLGRAVGRYV